MKSLWRLTILVLGSAACFIFSYFVVENWYKRYNVLRPIYEVIPIKFTSLAGLFFYCTLFTTVLVLIALARRQKQITKWWLVHVALVPLNVVYEFWQLFFPQYADDIVMDIILGTVGAVLSYLAIRFWAIRHNSLV